MNIFNFVICSLGGGHEIWIPTDSIDSLVEIKYEFEKISKYLSSNFLKTFLEIIGICTDSVFLWFEIFADSKIFCWFLVIWEFCSKFENCAHPLVCSSKTVYELLNTWCFCIFILNLTRVSTKKKTTKLCTSQFVLL